MKTTNLDKAIKIALTSCEGSRKYVIVLVSSGKDARDAVEYIRNHYRGQWLEVRIKEEPDEEIIYIDADK